MAHYLIKFNTNTQSYKFHTYLLCKVENLRRNHLDNPAHRRTGTGWRCRFHHQDIWMVHTGDTRRLQWMDLNITSQYVIT